MTTFEIVNDIATRSNLHFLIIGGHAVNAYGYTRFTQDVDILVNRDQKTVWITELAAKGFNLYHDGGAFLQMTAPPNSSPLDLMLVNATTFESLSQETKAAVIDGVQMHIPSLYNLFALKIHVLQQDLPHRGFKDFMDILSLAQCNGVDLRSDKYANCAKNRGIKRFMSDSLPSKHEFREPAVDYRTADAPFELPSSRANFSPPVLNPTQYAAWCRQMQRSLNLPTDNPALRLASKTSKEFVI